MPCLRLEHYKALFRSRITDTLKTKMVTIQASEPIYIFQMGKVGSVSVQDTLAGSLSNKIVHAHCFEEMSQEDQELLTSRHSAGLPITVITPVREPLSRNVSAFFQTFKRDTGFEFTARPWNQDELLTLFLQRYPHEESLDWFDISFRPMIGLDIYAEPFPRQQKWQVYTRGSFKVLIYRTDLSRQEQLAVIAGFVGCKVDAWIMGNRAEDKDYAEIYRAFCASAILPEDYISRMSASRFYRHFWSEDEINANADRWRRR